MEKLTLRRSARKDSYNIEKLVYQEYFKLVPKVFDIDEEITVSNCHLFAVFSQSKAFCGLIEKKDSKHFSYRFVIAFSR